MLRFSVGFGKALWSRHDRHGTEYVIAAIPLGGYVKMLDEREGEVAPARARPGAFNRKPGRQRMAIAAAGPAFNLIFAVVAFWLDVHDRQARTTSRSSAAPTGLAAHGRLPGRRPHPRASAARTIATWTDAIDALAQRVHRRDAPIDVAVATAAGGKPCARLPLEQLPAAGDADKALGEIGLQPQAPLVPAIAAKVTRRTCRRRAPACGDGDRIVAINGTPVSDFVALGELIQKRSGRNRRRSRFEIERGGQTLRSRRRTRDPAGRRRRRSAG